MKKNFSLVIGIAIPILMIALVAASIYLPGLFSPPPKVNFLYVLGDNHYEGQQYVVENGKLAKREVKYPEHYTPGVARLFVHNVTMNESREVLFEEAQQLSLDANAKSLNGYEVVYGSRGDGLFPFFFISSTDYDSVYLKGHRTSKKLNLPSPATGGWRYYGSNFRFLGWLK